MVEARESASMNSVGDRGHFDEFVFAAPGSKGIACDEMEIRR